jgi:hypothetical protein
MPAKRAKTAAELESMIMAELREYPECEAVGVVIMGPAGPDWDAGLQGEKGLNVECRVGLKEIISRLRHDFELADQRGRARKKRRLPRRSGL